MDTFWWNPTPCMTLPPRPSHSRTLNYHINQRGVKPTPQQVRVKAQKDANIKKKLKKKG